MAWRNSLHGQAVQYDEQFLYLRGEPVGLASQFLTRGKIFFVDSAVDGAKGDSPDNALGTIQEAVDLCTDDNYDQVIVMPGHTESIASTGAITLNKDGVTVTGLGAGGQRPTLQVTAGATARMVIEAANVTFRNFIMEAGVADIWYALGLYVAPGATLENLRFTQAASGQNFIGCIRSTGPDGYDSRLTVRGCKSVNADAAAGYFLSLGGDMRGLEVFNNVAVHPNADTAAQFISCTASKSMFNANVQGNFMQNAMTAGNLFVDNDQSDNTGIIAHNRCKHKDVTTTHTLITCVGVGLFDNLSTSVAGASGFVLPAIDVDL